MSPKPDYRPDIDGLRAVAVLSVVLYHYGASWLPGGFTGVDVFFVISGYLITKILRREIEAGEFSILGFYDRRIRRIIPALIVVLAATMLAGWFILMPGDYADLGASAAWAAAGLGNLYFFGNTGYFDEASEMQPLLHTWSLGVEEQFYVVWPLALLLGLTIVKNRRLFAALLSMAVVLAFAYAAHKAGHDPKGAFFLPHPRAWELALGALLVFLPAITGRLASEITAAIGAALIAWSLFRISAADAFPGINAAYACVGAALLIWPKAHNVVANGLSIRPVVWIGLISYSLYLWHWPLLVLYRRYMGAMPPVGTAVVLIFCSLLLAYLTWRFVERPFRKKPWNSRTVVFRGVACAAAIAFAGFTLSLTSGVPERFPVGVRKVLAMAAQDFISDARYPHCWLETGAHIDSMGQECDLHAAEVSVAFWGDSHAARLYPGLLGALPRDVGLRQYTRNKCPPLLRAEIAECRDGNLAIMERIEQSPPDVVILFAMWPMYGTWAGVTDLDQKLAEAIIAIQNAGVNKILLIGPPPAFLGSLPSQTVRHWQTTGELPDQLPIDPQWGTLAIEQSLHAVAQQRGIDYVSLLDRWCNGANCTTHIGSDKSDLIAWDYGHLTDSGSRDVASAIIEKIRF